MPRTLQYRPKLIEELITNERLNSYKVVFKPADDVELMGVYLWNTHVCGAIYPLVCAAEITLRNSIDQALTAHLGGFWWKKGKLLYNSFVPGDPEPDPVNKLRSCFASASRKFLSERKQRYNIPINVPPTHHGIIAKTDFSTWEYILDNEFMGNKCIWPSRLGTVFTGRWPKQKPSSLLAYVRDLVSTIRQFRNRLFHHEPAWKRSGVMNEAQAIQHLHEKIKKIEILIELLYPEKLRLLDKNGLLKNSYRACSSHEIQRFQHLIATSQINSLTDFELLIDTCTQGGKILKARLYNRTNEDFLIIPI